MSKDTKTNVVPKTEEIVETDIVCPKCNGNDWKQIPWKLSYKDCEHYAHVHLMCMKCGKRVQIKVCTDAITSKEKRGLKDAD